MTRECSNDYVQIKDYIEKYSISNNLHEDGFSTSLKKIHKCYFSSIAWNSELAHSKDVFLESNKNCNAEIAMRLSEVVSDIGSCVFNWISGNYKTSNIMLRVSIENFVRAISAVEEKSQLSEKNAYRLFEVASAQSIMKPCIACYKGLHADYKTLCADVHTASQQNMANLTSLADLPSFEKNKSHATEVLIVRVCKNITSMFCIIFNDFFHKMHHRNKENILNSLNSSIKPVIANPAG